MRDVVTLGETMVLLNPRDPGPLKYVTDFKKQLAGAESNVAIGLARLGHDAGWISRLGDDPHGRYVEAFVRGEGVDTAHVRYDDAVPTGLMFKERRALGETNVYYYRHDSAASRLGPDDLPEAYVADASYLHLTGITPALSDSCRAATFEAAEIAAANDVALSVDGNVRRKLWADEDEMRDVLFDLLARADVAFVGDEEGELLFGVDDPEAIADGLLDLGAATAVVTLGADGALAADGEATHRVDAWDVEVADTVGAGDGFAAGFLAGRLRGRSLAEATALANAVGAFATTVPGDIEGLPTQAEVEAFTGERERIAR